MEVLDSNSSEGKYLYFSIRPIDVKVPTYVSDQRYSARHQTVFQWDELDRVWVYSGDVGVFYWTKNPQSGTWTRATFSPGGDVTPPPYLRSINPKLFE